MPDDGRQSPKKLGNFGCLRNLLSTSAPRFLGVSSIHVQELKLLEGVLGWDCVGNENRIRREPCKQNRMKSRKPCRIGGKIHILEAHADHEMMSLTHVGLRKNAKPGSEKTRPPKVLEPKQENKIQSTQRQEETPTPHARLEQQKLEKYLQTPCKETKPS